MTVIKSGDRPAYNVAPTLPTPQPYYPSTTPIAAVVVAHSTMAPPVYVPASSARPYSVTVPPTVYRSVYTCVLTSHTTLKRPLLSSTSLLIIQGQANIYEAFRFDGVLRRLGTVFPFMVQINDNKKDQTLQKPHPLSHQI